MHHIGIAFVSGMCPFCVEKEKNPSCLPENQANTPQIPALSHQRSRREGVDTILTHDYSEDIRSAKSSNRTSQENLFP